MTEKNRIPTTQASLLGLLFFGLPLVFSHFLFLALPRMGYERGKVYFLMIIIFLVSGITFVSDIKNFRQNTVKLLMVSCISAILGFYWVFFQNNAFSESLMGTPEKQHGILFFLSLLGLFWVFDKLPSRGFGQQVAEWSIYAGIIVCAYALIQYIGWDPVTGYSHGGWNVDRVFSTLGNPNYLAGYLLILLPLLDGWGRWKQACLWILFSIVIVLTGSAAGIMLMLGYFLWKFLSSEEKGTMAEENSFAQGRKYRFVLGICLLGIFGFIYFLFHIEKILSMSARFSLWDTAFRIFLQDPYILFLGNGPDSIPAYFAQHRITLDPFYFSPGVLDSFHNIFIDSFFFFGLPITLAGLVMLVRHWKYTPKRSREGILLFFLFFSLNIAISVHYVLFVWYLLWPNTHKDSEKEIII